MQLNFILPGCWDFPCSAPNGVKNPLGAHRDFRPGVLFPHVKYHQQIPTFTGTFVVSASVDRKVIVPAPCVISS